MRRPKCASSGVVPTLEEERQTARTWGVGAHQSSELRKVPRREGEFTERIGPMGIETTRHQDPIWRKAVDHRVSDLLERTLDHVTGGTGWQGMLTVRPTTLGPPTSWALPVPGKRGH